MCWLWENAEKLGALATVLAALVGILALAYADYQIKEARKIARETNAYELWREYQRHAFENPKLADPSLRLADFDYEALTIDGSPELFQQYERFIDFVLNACEEIFTRSEEWKLSVRDQIKLHRGYLESAHFLKSGYFEHYNPKFRAFIKQSLEETRGSASPVVARKKGPAPRSKKRA
jgi:hypothetical protein